MESELPIEVQSFIAQHIVSVEELEVLVLLHDEPDRAWAAGEVNERLRSQEPSIAKWLEVLVHAGLATVTNGRYRFAPASEHLRRQTAALVRAYRGRRIKVIEFIFSKPNETLLSFVRAFELRKRP